MVVVVVVAVVVVVVVVIAFAVVVVFTVADVMISLILLHTSSYDQWLQLVCVATGEDGADN